ncbi:XisI protein [Dactylococcopsis salina]|uniref:XisI protein n=1 Tax=Dactylococcopsis salina (strain PCC 8305) TaxID=13035 RepID=K9YVR9_DACS8|nr:XisI protein [Dactylococcopsis salina]AFZ50994.1 XisI protein [Dactylococcopsis salina PCC 8305]
MDKLTQYRKLIKKLLSRYASYKKDQEGWELQLIFDEERDHYLWFDVGWNGTKRIYHCVIHLDIKDGKVWLQQNSTDLNPAEDLIELGVAREDIILGLQPPYKRPFTNYGVA